MQNVRIVFNKKDRAKYISHLDLNRCMQRALKRADLPIWYTEGFNPHAYINFMLPLALGIESICEAMDIKLADNIDFETVKNKLNQVLPPDLAVINVDEPKYKQTEIIKAQYEVNIDTDLRKLDEFFDLQEIITKKRTKRGFIDVDLKQSIELVCKNENNIVLNLPAGTVTNISPILVFDTFKEVMNTAVNSVSYKRIKIICEMS